MTELRRLLNMYAQAQEEIFKLKRQRDAAIAVIRIARAKGFARKELKDI